MAGTEHKGLLGHKAENARRKGVWVSFSCQWEPLKGLVRAVMQSDLYFERIIGLGARSVD